MLWQNGFSGPMSQNGMPKTKAGIGKAKSLKVYFVSYQRVPRNDSILSDFHFLSGGHLKRVMKWLRPEEFGLDGYPLPNAVPPNPLPVYQQQPPPAPQPSAFNLDTPRPSQQVDQPLLNNVSLNEQSKAPGLAFFSDYRSHDSNLNRRRYIQHSLTPPHTPWCDD